MNPPRWETLVKYMVRSPAGFPEGVSRGWFLNPPRWETFVNYKDRELSGLPEGSQ